LLRPPSTTLCPYTTLFRSKRPCDLLRQAFLHLQPTGKNFGDPRKFRKPDYPAAFRYISDVAFSDERSEMVFAHRCDRNIFDNDQDRKSTSELQSRENLVCR